MEIKEKVNIEQLVGVKKQKKFSITSESMQMIFHALINMYSDPVGSIVREITSNCLDAHTEREAKKAGTMPLSKGEDIRYFSDNKKVQIEYIKSNRILGIGEAIIFRDFGVGLSEERVEAVYTVFGESTKRIDNQQIGGFGLGCKSPFTFTDTFYITTSYNGRLYYYMLSKTNDGLSMDLMHETESDTKNYSEVIIPIAFRHERQKFIEAVQEQLIYIQNIEYIGLDLVIPKIVYEDEHVVVTNDKSYRSLSLLIGPIRYPLDYTNSDFGGIFNDYISLDHTIAFKIPIGALELVPSRESIIYSPVTIKVIKEKIKLISELYAVSFAKEADKVAKGDLYQQMKWVRGFQDSHEYLFEGESLVFYCLSKIISKLKIEGVISKICSYTWKELEEAFEGLNIQKIDRTYKRRSRLFDISTGKMLLYELFLDRASSSKKFYQTKRDLLSSAINREIINSNNNLQQFFIFKVGKDTTGLTEIETALYKTILDHVDELFSDNYDTYVPSKKVVIKEERLSIKELVYSEVAGMNERNCRFQMHSVYPDELEKAVINSRTIIYGFQEDDELLKQIGYLLLMNSNYRLQTTWYEDRLIKQYVFLKIAKDSEDYFTDGIYIKELIKMKHKFLKDWYTIELIRPRLKGMDYFKRFDQFFPMIQNLYSELNSLVAQQGHISKDLYKDIFELCADYDLAHKPILKKMEFLERYHQGIEFIADFNYFNHNKIKHSVTDKVIEKEIRNILRNKGKRVTFVDIEESPNPATTEDLKETEESVLTTL